MAIEISQLISHIEVTATDADGKQVKSTNLTFDVLQEQQSQVNGSINATPILHN